VYPGRPVRRRTPWFLIVGLAIVVALVVILVALLVSGAFGPSAGRPYYGPWGGFLLVFLLVWIVFFAVRVVFWSQRMHFVGAGPGYSRPDPAVMVARRRYARGEITREQYDQIMSDLGRKPPLP
jgi:uncharacterized membrane protein